jgi:hypothetical protein
MNFMSFGELYIFRDYSGNMKRMNSRRLQKTPELIRSRLQENMHLEGTRGPHVKEEPSRGPARPTGPIGRPIGFPLAPIRPFFGMVPPPPLRVNLDHLFGSV